MEPCGPYNPWDPPPPQGPPNFGGHFHPPDAFHHPHHPNEPFHHFPCPPGHFNGPPDHFRGPHDQLPGPPGHFNGPPDHFNAPPDHFNGPPDHFNGPPDHFNGRPDNFDGPPDLLPGPPGHFNGPPDHFSGASGGYAHPKPNFFRKRNFDHKPDSSVNQVKLYVGNIPKDVTQEEVRNMFADFGNVIEVVLVTDKKTGLWHEYCFVKYAFLEEAESAIMALHNQITFPRAVAQLTVRFADRARQRLGFDNFVQHDSSFSQSGPMQQDMPMSGPVDGEPEHKVTKVFVNGFYRETSEDELKEVFASYGVVVDIYIMRDNTTKRSRGCGFVGFSHRYMAVAAINGLNDTYVMRGCSKPLNVRFADPKKPKNRDSRAQPPSGDMRQNNIFNALPMGNSPASAKLNSPGVVTGTLCAVVKPDSSEMQRMPPLNPCSPSPWPQISLQKPQTLQTGPHSQSQVCRDAESESCFLTPEPVSLDESEIHISEDSLDCVWSEHICPDGEKYYYNSETTESRWDKPEEFVMFERLMLKQIEAARLHKPCDFDKAQLSGSCAA